MTDQQDLSDLKEAPWASETWHGDRVSVDGTTVSDVAIDDVALVVARHDAGGDYGDLGVMVLQLMDGRFVSWETWVDVTGSGFREDAYGGDATVFFAASIERAAGALSERARDLVRDHLDAEVRMARSNVIGAG